MPKTANKVSYLIETQLPDFINEDYELFGKFIKKYYEQLEIQGQPLDIVTNLKTYRDIDFYEKNVLVQGTKLNGLVLETDTSITVDDASSFPEKGGYIKIDDEICFYGSRTNTEFLEVSRGVSGNSTLGDLYQSSTFTTTQAVSHANGSTVQNISNLFLYALVKSFEKQYLTDFPEEYLKGDIDKRTLIKNIKSFYQSKGTDNSIKFLFKCLVDLEGPNPDVVHPRDFTLKSSESNWIQTYSLKAKVISGTPTDLIGKTIVQDVEGSYASAVVDNVRYSGKYDGEELYEIILNEATVNGEFKIASRTKLTSAINNSLTIGGRVNVFSTLAWGDRGEFNVGGETITYEEKNVNQFVIKTRSGTGTYPVNTAVTYGANVGTDTVDLLIYGVLYNVEPSTKVPYSNSGEVIEISEPGFITNDIKIVDAQNNTRWIFSSTDPQIASVADLPSNVSAIYQDGEGYYIASSGFPSHAIGTGTPPADLQDQKLLKIIRKTPISTTETYETKYRDVGIALNGVPFVGYKDEDVVYNGPLQTITVGNRGNGYATAPFVLVNGLPNRARAKLAGQVVESISIDQVGNYTENPTVEIVSGRNALVTPVVTAGEVTSITINNPGEYYSSPPIVRITDGAGKGRFADFTAEVSNTGEITGFVKNNGGSLYTQNNISISLIPVGSSATATAKIKEWRKDSYFINKSNLDSENGYFFKNFSPSLGNGYAYYASPTTLRANDNGSTHSPILGFAYDGNPIYGAYGYENPLDMGSSIVRMTSSYTALVARDGGPDDPIGTYINDYVYEDESGSLDANNGRYCVTPEYPNGTYAYFITVDGLDRPVFPYIIGTNYYSLPLDSNYNSSISQTDIPKKAKRLRTSDIDNNGDITIAQIEDTNRGSVSSASIFSSGDNFSVGCKLLIDDSNTGGSGAAGEVESVKGKNVVSVNSQDSKVLYVNLSETAYLFDGDTITQSVTGANGKIVGNVFSGRNFAVEDISGTMNSTDVLSSSTKVLSLILDINVTYTKGAILSLSDGINAPIATGEVLEATSAQNSVKIKVTDTGFVVDGTYFLTSSDLLNTPGAKIVSISNLSENLSIFNIQDNVALLTTDTPHGIGIGESIDIHIDPDDSSTNKTYSVKKRIYQDITLKNPVVARVLNDSGLGRVSILNGGADYTQGEYTNVNLIGGTGSGAKATIKVSSDNRVYEVIVTDKGTGYVIGDELSIGTSVVFKTNNNTPELLVRVDHVGFSSDNTLLFIDNGNGLKQGDYLNVGNEVVLVQSRSGNILTVQRGQKNTIAVNHFNGTSVSLYDGGYVLPVGFTVEDGSVISYDPETQKLVVAWNYNQTLSTITALSLSSTFFDKEDPDGDKRLVEISSISTPKYYFEIDGERNKDIDIKKYYKYTFDTTHISMTGVGFDISPSINLNLVTPEKTEQNNIVDLKLGYGPRTSTNLYDKRKPISYTKYYYYDRDGIVDSENSYLSVVDDPLQGTKTAIYVTPSKILYSTDIKATNDGSGSIKYISKSITSVGQINSIKITSIGTDYTRIPIVSGIYDKDNVLDNNVECFLMSTDIGTPRNIKIINNGGSYHNDETLSSSFTSNYVLTLSNFVKDAFSIGETIIQKSGSVEVARARVTSWIEGSNILTVDRIQGILREDKEIKGLAKSNTANLLSISYTEYSPVIKTYFDNMGYYKSDSGKVSDANQRITDSYYYQDYSYTIKSETPINIWRKLIKETTHPAGFQLFGEVRINTSADVKMSSDTVSSKTSVIQLWDPEVNKITVESTRRQLTQSLVTVQPTLVEKGVGSVSIDAINTAEITAGDVFLSLPFNGALTNKGNLEGRTLFNMVDANGNSVRPYNEQALVITLDGILQEPGVSYTINEDKITFAQPPLGSRVKGGQDIPSVAFYGRYFQFKDNTLNQKHLKKIKNIFQRSGRWIDSANQIERNKSTIVDKTITHMKSLYPELPWNVTEGKCSRDIGYILDAWSHDIRFGGNWKTVAAGKEYYTGGVLSSLTGTGVVTDPNTGDKTSELEAAIEAYQYAVGLAKQAVNNELSDGYENTNILADNATNKCANVISALDTLSNVLTLILTNGENSATLTNPDYFDGESKIFDLYYEDGTDVDTQVNEDLFIALSGVLQHNPAYTIDRTVVPNKIVFDSAPIWNQSENTKTLQEPLAVEKFFGHGIGSYLRCHINEENSAGPYLILDSDKKVKVINDTRLVLVFIDGVLQREVKSYNIVGPAITFNKKIQKGNNVEIIVLYGRDIDPAMTLYDFEAGQYFNEIILTCDAGSANTFGAWKDWYGLSYDYFQVAYQKVGGTKRMLGNVKSYTTTDQKLIITLVGNNPDLDNSNVFFARSSDFADEYELTGVTNTIEVVRDSDQNYRMQRNSARWLYGTPRADEAFYVRNRLLSNINDGDIVKIDGEDDYRTINGLPRYVNPKTYVPQEEVSTGFYGTIITTNYAGDTRGVGLSATCEIDGGKVSSISWNRATIELIESEWKVTKGSTAYGYDSTPVLHFIPVDQNGGGATAEVIVSDGHIIDIVLTNAGSGYTQAPKIVTARQYKIIKQRGRKIASTFTLKFNPNVVYPSPVAVYSEVTRMKGIEAGPGVGNLDMAITTPEGFKQKITAIIQTSSGVDIKPVTQQVHTYYPPGIASIPAPSVVEKQITLEIETDTIVQVRLPVIEIDQYGNRRVRPDGSPGDGSPIGGGGEQLPMEKKALYNMGFVDLRRINYQTVYEQGTLGPRFLQWEGAKFMTTGDILSTGGISVSAYTIQEFEGFDLELRTFEDQAQSMVATNDYIFNIGYPSINHYVSQLDTSDLPNESGGGYTATNETVYANTTNFPASGTILLGREQISYTSKMSDRFLGCTRGVNNTPIESHTIGEFLRNAL